MDLQAGMRPDGAGETGSGCPTGRFVAVLRVVHPRPPPAARAADDPRLGRLHAFGVGVEAIAEAFGAVLPLTWEEEGVTLLIPRDAPDGLSVLAHRVAEQVWHRALSDLDCPVRVAAHVARVRTLDSADPGLQAEILCCREATEAMRAPAPVVTEDVALGLPDGLREALVRVRARGEVRGVVYAPREAESGVVDAADIADDAVGELCDGLRRYVRGSDFARLRYVGFRLQRKEPPSLDVREVFVPQHVRPRRDRGLSGSGLSGSGMSGSGMSERGPSAGEEVLGERGPASPIPLEAAVERYSSLVFLGDPGSGKTTLLRWLAVVAAGGRLAWAAAFGQGERWIPVPLSVGRLTELRRSFAPGHPSVLDAAARYFRERNVPLEEPALREALHEVLSAGEALVLLDGLDEVRADERAAIRGWLESFAAQYPRCRFFATSREVGYSGFAVAGGEEVRVEPFDAPQVERFVHAFVRGYRRMETGEDDPDASGRTAQDFLAALERDPRIGALAKNPFLLSALALMHRSETRLPRHRVLAYELFSRALCETWADARRLVAGETGKPSISYEDEALPVLGHLALAMHEEHPDGAAPEDFVLDTLEEALSQQQTLKPGEARRAAKTFLARAGEEVQILLPRGPEQWGFLHLTFQEFFAAAGLHAQERFEEVLFRKLFDPRWLEVLRLGIGYLALVQKRHRKVNELIERVLDWQEPPPRAWLTETLRKQVVRAAQFAAEAGEALRQEVRDRVVVEAARWMATTRPAGLGLDVARAVSGYDFARPLARALLDAVSSEVRPSFTWIRHAIWELDREAAIETARRAIFDCPTDEAIVWLELFPHDEVASHLEGMPEQIRSLAAFDLASRSLLQGVVTPSAWRAALWGPNPGDWTLVVMAMRYWGPVPDTDEGRGILVDALDHTAPAIRAAAFDGLLRTLRWSAEISTAMRVAASHSVRIDNARAHALRARDASSDAAIEPFVESLLASLGPDGQVEPDAAEHLAWALRRATFSCRVRDALVREARAATDAHRRAAAVRALVCWRESEEAVGAAVDCLTEGPDLVRLFALWALELIDPQHAAKLWLELVRSPSATLRAMAMHALSVPRWPRAARTSLCDALLHLAEHDPDWVVQQDAITALQAFQSPRVVEVLTRLASAETASPRLTALLRVLAAWGIEVIALFADRLEPEMKLQVLWTLSENLPSCGP